MFFILRPRFVLGLQIKSQATEACLSACKPPLQRKCLRTFITWSTTGLGRMKIIEDQ